MSSEISEDVQTIPDVGSVVLITDWDDLQHHALVTAYPSRMPNGQLNCVYVAEDGCLARLSKVPHKSNASVGCRWE